MVNFKINSKWPLESSDGEVSSLLNYIPPTWVHRLVFFSQSTPPLVGTLNKLIWWRLQYLQCSNQISSHPSSLWARIKSKSRWLLRFISIISLDWRRLNGAIRCRWPQVECHLHTTTTALLNLYFCWSSCSNPRNTSSSPSTPTGWHSTNTENVSNLNDSPRGGGGVDHLWCDLIRGESIAREIVR